MNYSQLKKYGINPTDVKIIDGKPWLNAEQLAAIARQSPELASIVSEFRNIVADQVIYCCIVVDSQNRTFARTGVAKIGERLKTGEEINEHVLAETRAVRAALALAGFDFMRAGSVVNLKNESEAEAKTRHDQQARLHILAKEKGLIVEGMDGKDDLTMYRSFLYEEFGVKSSAAFTEEEYARAINLVEQIDTRKVA